MTVWLQEARTIDIDTCQSWYFRANEPQTVVDKMIDIVEDALRSPEATTRARHLAARWGGDDHTGDVLEAFTKMRDSFAIYRAPFFGPRGVVLSAGHAYTVTNRLITRPLLAKPELLTPVEEAYFLPFIFATDENLARMDYNTAHGYRRTAPEGYRSLEFHKIYDPAIAAAETFERITGAPEERWFRQLALSLCLWASMVRSHDNFYAAQVIRDRHAKDLAGPRPASPWPAATTRK